MLAALACSSVERDSQLGAYGALPIPPGWIATPPYDPRPVDGECVNFTRVAWMVAISPDSDKLVITRIEGSDSPDTVRTDVRDGRLIGYNYGEFGGDVWFVKATTSDSVHVHSGNLVAFARVDSGFLGLAGLSHGVLDTGYVLRFAPTTSGWTATHVMNLGEAPHAYTLLGGDTLLVVSGSTLRVVRPPATNRVVHESDAWPYTYPSSIVRDRSGVVYVGMRRAVARLTPAAVGFSEDWLVPTGCPRLDPGPKTPECPCASLPR
jgi:hypothetical protein